MSIKIEAVFLPGTALTGRGDGGANYDLKYGLCYGVMSGPELGNVRVSN